MPRAKVIFPFFNGCPELRSRSGRVPCCRFLKFFFANHQTDLGSRMRRKFLGDRIARCPNHFSTAGQNRPITPGALRNSRLQEQAFQFSNAPAPMRAVGVTRSPIPEDQWPLDTVEIKGTPIHYSVALGRRPVNHFQVEAALNFRNNNGSGFPSPRLRNTVGEIAVSACCFPFSRGIRSRGNASEAKPVKNSFDKDSG